MAESRRDSRTDEQREADEQRERDWHKARAEAGLPPVHYAVNINLSIRDVTDEEAKAINDRIWDAALTAVHQLTTDREDRAPTLSGGGYQVEPNVDAAE